MKVRGRLMPRSMAWLLLVLTLTGPLLTHAEAADDLARSLIEATDEGGIAIEDGGVGDDPVVAADWPDGPSIENPVLLACDWVEFLTVIDEPAGWMSRPVVEPFRWPSTDRQAWLQVFRD